ncbi:MAG: hypothetical protein KKE62_14275 [Proteobacteria bacterium]|nr:hypothetical protein [Pseudomonadota bacterium]MBU1543996.1 hypothetical protein [Pseudomonadota bacterium]MBU2430671.1 hypothetical protein [Pseudomonadota bacterium]MBU2481467.1 hypothetical protein [Pseudomonadota bacterium]
MANTEKFAVLKKIRNIKKEIQIMKGIADHPAKKELEDAFIFLDDLEDELIYSELEKRVTEIESISKKLKSVVKTASEKSDDLKKIAEKINNIADLFSKLIDIAGKGAELLL